MKKVLIIDTGLASQHGHNFSLAINFHKIFRKKGFNVDIVGLRNSSKYILDYFKSNSVNYYPIITYNCFSDIPHKNEKNFLLAVQCTKDELFKFLNHESHYDIVLWPPASSTVQLAVNVLYKINCKKNFYFVERNPLSLTNLTELYMPRLRKKINERSDLMILTTDPGSQLLHQNIFKVNVNLTPLMTISKMFPNKNFLKNVGIFSVHKQNQNKMKKIYNFCELFPNINFYIHDPWKNIQKRDENFYLHIKNLFFFEFELQLDKKIASFQAVINHLNPELYKYLYSGLHFESVAVGRTILTTKDTNVSQFIAKNKNGLLYEYDDFECLFNKFKALKKNFEAINKNARKCCESWHKVNGLKKIIEFMLQKYDSDKEFEFNIER